MNGRYSFPDTDRRSGEHGDELARAGVQHEAGDQVWVQSTDKHGANKSGSTRKLTRPATAVHSTELTFRIEEVRRADGGRSNARERFPIGQRRRPRTDTRPGEECDRASGRGAVIRVRLCF